MKRINKAAQKRIDKLIKQVDTVATLRDSIGVKPLQSVKSGIRPVFVRG